MKIISWNVNSVRARIDNILHFLNSESIDCLLLQETKCMEKDFPYETFEDLGYNCAVYGQKSYNGVAILSKYPLEDIKTGIDEDDNIEARYIEACLNCDGKIFCVASVYVPNGRLVDSDYFEYKLKYFQRIKKQIELKLKL
ncbi:MAG: exodeoxyribonuclease III, partial [Candidatus Heimdallarchaeota archaeon]|nr:exodeoxyribonuclease III [Candidatus Heimdallarchaeota archaeon]